MIEVKLPDEAGNVVELAVVRDSILARRAKEQCPHRRVKIDTVLSQLICRDCKASLNPVGWLAMLAEEWARVRRLTEQLRDATAKFEAKKRTRCEHCFKVTKVNPATPAEVREFSR